MGIIHKLENDYIIFTVEENGYWRIYDRTGGTNWSAAAERFGTVAVKAGDTVERITIHPYYIRKRTDVDIDLHFHDTRHGRLALIVHIHLSDRRLDISYDNAGEILIEEISLIDGMRLSGQDSAYILPVRSGLYINAGSGKSFEYDVDTYVYEGLDMAMFAALQGESALMMSWDDPYTTLSLKGDGEGVDGKLTMRRSARNLSIRVVPDGGINAVAAAYRELAGGKGHLFTWKEKSGDGHPCEKLFGAINFKIWFCMLNRINIDMELYYSEMICSFQEAAETAEHLKQVLELDRVLFLLGGWTTTGYDGQHPDIMPANEECGGTPGLKECADRVKELGYLFGLHDNYQDMYRDAPSWDETYLMRLPGGEVNQGDVWAGGLAFRICSKRALELAMRPQNMPAVKSEIDPSAYFIDTTLAARLYECFSPDHPLTLQDDLHYKRELARYTRETFGICGSECGREWAFDVADFFEGAAGAGGKCYHHLEPADIGAVSIPFFEMVFHDCVANYGKYHYHVHEAADYVAHHATLARTLNYHLGPDEKHHHWEGSETNEFPRTDGPDRALYTRAHNGWAEGMCKEDRFIKNTYELLSPLNLLTTHERLTDFRFLDEERMVYRSDFGDKARSIANRSEGRVTIHSAVYGEVALPTLRRIYRMRRIFGTLRALLRREEL